jgi:hypothetical protein
LTWYRRTMLIYDSIYNRRLDFSIERMKGCCVRFVTNFAIALVAWHFSPPVNAAADVVQRGKTFRCTPVAVYDGDGPIWCAEGPKVRIAGVAAREMDGTCRPNQPCPPISAIDARDRVVRLFGGPKGTLPQGHIIVRSATMTCLSDGSAGGSRTAAWCTSAAFGDLSCAVLRAGGVLRWPRYWRNHRC